MDRRSLLAALAAGVAGCSTARPPESRADPTVTPLEVPESDRREGRVATEPLSVEESRFGPDAPRPADGRWFHRLAPDYEVGLLPARETFSPAAPAAPVWLRNRRSRPLSVTGGWSLRKFSGHRWVPVLGSPLERGGVRVGPHEEWARRHRIENVYDLPVLGPGLYARTREVRLEDGSTGGTPVSVGALFAVEGTDYETTPRRAAERDGDAATLETSPYADEAVVFERLRGVDPGEAASLVPEAIGPVPAFRDALPLLGAVEVVRVVTGAASVTFGLLEAATVREVSVGPGTPLALDGTVFAARTEGT